MTKVAKTTTRKTTRMKKPRMMKTKIMKPEETTSLPALPNRLARLTSTQFQHPLTDESSRELLVALSGFQELSSNDFGCFTAMYLHTGRFSSCGAKDSSRVSVSVKSRPHKAHTPCQGDVVDLSNATLPKTLSSKNMSP